MFWFRKKKLEEPPEYLYPNQKPKGVKKVKNHGRPIECEFCKVSTETHKITLRKRIMNNRKIYVCDICSGRGR